MKKLLIALLAGVFVGLVTSRYLFVNSALGLIPWSVAGLLLGMWCANRKKAVVVGGAYGFALLFSFMFGGYNGSESLISRIIPFAFLGLIGALGGIALTEIGIFFRKQA